MASVHRDPRSPKGVWYCSYTLADGRRTCRSTGAKSKTQAKIICEAWAETERAALSGALSTSRAAQIINETLARCGSEPVTRYRLGSWLTEWLEAKTKASPRLKKRYQFAASKFLACLGPGSERRFLDSINERDIRRFADQLKSEGRCAVTVNRIIRADLGNAFNRALKLGKLRFNPIAGLESEKDQGLLASRQTFTPQQVAKLVETSRGTDWEGAILFGYTTGARLSDVANLRWDSIDLAEHVIGFHQRKTNNQTFAWIHPDFQNWLSRQPALDKPQAFVFPTLANCSTGGKQGLSNRFNQIVTQAGIEAGLIRQKHGVHGRSRRNLSFHSLRHTAASNVFNAAAIKEIARRVTGHTEGGSLDRYLHVNLEAIKVASALIPRLPL